MGSVSKSKDTNITAEELNEITEKSFSWKAALYKGKDSMGLSSLQWCIWANWGCNLISHVTIPCHCFKIKDTSRYAITYQAINGNCDDACLLVDIF